MDGKGIDPMAPRGPHFAPKAKRVIHLFMNGGPSHMDTFDPKPELNKWHGKILPEETSLQNRTQNRCCLWLSLCVQEAMANPDCP